MKIGKSGSPRVFSLNSPLVFCFVRKGALGDQSNTGNAEAASALQGLAGQAVEAQGPGLAVPGFSHIPRVGRCPQVPSLLQTAAPGKLASQAPELGRASESGSWVSWPRPEGLSCLLIITTEPEN